ncbi:MAG: sensor histidine kinase [Conexibacter sp.]|nr:sensor histidine kinase [Conexibacter sp.]
MSRARYALGLVLLPATYYGAAKSGYVLDFAGPVAAILWLPVGVAIAFLYLGGLRFWPGVLVGDLLANDYGALPLGSALGQTCGNVLEVLLATVLMRRLIRDRSPTDSAADLGRMLVAIAAGVAISATIGATSSWLGGVIPLEDIPSVWRTWWLGDCCGAVVVVPLAVAWHRPPPRSWWGAHGLELGLAVVAVAGLSELALRSHSPATYIVFPALAWAALRFGPRGATLAVAVTTAFTAWNTTHFLGPFAFDSVTRSVLNTQLYIGVAAISTLSLAAVVAEREQFAEKLRASRARLVEASDSDRRRIERALHDGAQQRLIALAAYLGIAARRARETPEEAPALFEEADDVLSLAIDDLRALARGIHPTVLADLGLARAIGSVASHSAVPITVLDLPSARFDQTTEATAYYVVAEAITNAQRFAHASQISVRAVAAPSHLRVEVFDDGVGGARACVGSGLQTLRDRVEATGGTLDIESAAGRGTLVAAAIPAILPDG